MVTLYPTKDSAIRDENPTTNYGTSTLTVAGVDEGDIRRAIFEFNISSISSAAAITSATLRLYNTGGNDGTETLYSNRVTDNSWTENGVTWNNKPTYTTTNQASLSIGAGFPAWREWNVTNLVKDARTAGTICGIYVMNDSATYYKTFHTKENTNDPELVIVHTDADRYVDIATGSDSDDGKTWVNAYLTVKKGIDNVPLGYIIHIAEGNYSAQAAIDLNKNLELLCEDYGGGVASPPLTVVLPVTT